MAQSRAESRDHVAIHIPTVQYNSGLAELERKEYLEAFKKFYACCELMKTYKLDRNELWLDGKCKIGMMKAALKLNGPTSELIQYLNQAVASIKQIPDLQPKEWNFLGDHLKILTGLYMMEKKLEHAGVTCTAAISSYIYARNPGDAKAMEVKLAQILPEIEKQLKAETSVYVSNSLLGTPRKDQPEKSNRRIYPANPHVTVSKPK